MAAAHGRGTRRRRSVALVRDTDFGCAPIPLFQERNASKHRGGELMLTAEWARQVRVVSESARGGDLGKAHLIVEDLLHCFESRSARRYSLNV